MSYFGDKYIKARRFDIDTTDFQFITLAQLYHDEPDKVYTLAGVYINTKSKYGENPIFATNEFLVNCPVHMLETAKNIINDPLAIDDINAGRVGFKVYAYHNAKFNRDCFGVAFVDIA